MRYSDLIQFDPIESVVQLRESDKKEKAQELVRSYVISKDMADRLTGIFFPNLLLEGNPDTKGVLVVSPSLTIANSDSSENHSFRHFHEHNSFIISGVVSRSANAVP
jgi:hypothetical protein